jgi:hypothetical protein
MGLDVGRQRGLDGKGAETLRAFVWLLVRMNTDVAHQVGRFLELLTAVGALMPSHTIHLIHKRKSFQLKFKLYFLSMQTLTEFD